MRRWCAPKRLARRWSIAAMRGAMLVALPACLAAPWVQASIRVVDDRGNAVVLPSVARRIVSLAPHTTELLFAAGAGDRVVGTVDFSDFPAAAKAIPRVGSSSLLDVERIVALRPDVIVVWWHGNPESQLDRLRGLGIALFYDEPHTLDDIPRALIQLGTLAGTETPARAAADAYAKRLATLRARYASRSPVSLFWQVWSRPLLTFNGRHLVSDVIRLCGGRNIFETLTPLVPSVSVEAVVQADPEAIVTTSSDSAADGGDGLDVWRKLGSLEATSRHNLIVLEAETIHRPTPRILDGAAALCAALEDVRARRRR